jgi:5-methylcytosine-specific restriction endonuclease McrA
MATKPRDYSMAGEGKYDSQPKIKKRRAARNKARRQLMKEGLVHKGDGKDVDHKKALSKGGSKARSNLRVLSASANRSYPRTKQGSMK